MERKLCVVLEVGRQYFALRPATRPELIDGEIFAFDEERKSIEVLKKPKTIIVSDGETETREALPEHLVDSDWYFVLDLNTQNRFWFYLPSYQVNEL